ncbi:MAG TPA: hypothetical protein VNO22_07825 [Planctomycetota bacterium]|nr:hypothetical protein [Planctomycetota bacterium]
MSVKKIFLENLTTKAMALFLAVLTWVYLFTQSNGPGEIEVQFWPNLDMKDFASVSYRDGDRELVPGGSLRIRVVGPKGDVRTLSLRPMIFRCDFRIDPKELTGLKGTYKISLIRENFNLPANFSIEPLPQIAVHYTKYVEKELELVADLRHYQGQPRPGYQVESITTLPRRIRAKVPADLENLERVDIRRVDVTGRFESFSVERWELDPAALEARLQPVESFRVEVKIVPQPARRRFTVDLHVAARPHELHRVELDTPRAVLIEVQGPQELLRDVSESAFFAYVVVTEKDLESVGPRNIKESGLGCHILDPRLQGRVTVVFMPDERPENREVKIKIVPRS